MNPNDRTRINAAIKEWFDVKDSQGSQPTKDGQRQGGNRATVTGGKHLRGVNQLIVDEISRIDAPGLDHRTDRNAELPGWYRRYKQWDLLVLQHDIPILAVEYKSMTGSVGKNANNRVDEVIGVAEDARQATENGFLPEKMRRAYIYLLEVTDEAVRKTDNKRPAGNPDIMFQADDEFNNTSYLDRFSITAQRMRKTGLYHLVWVLGATRDPLGFIEPSIETGWDRFAHDLRAGFDWHGEAR